MNAQEGPWECPRSPGGPDPLNDPPGADAAYLAAFTDGYVECALWVGVLVGDDEYGPVDLSDDALAEIRGDCRDFVTHHRHDLDAAGGDPGQHGQDFFLTRNRHGAGYWDRGYGEVGDRLTEASHPYGEQSLTLAADGTLEVA